MILFQSLRITSVAEFGSPIISFGVIRSQIGCRFRFQFPNDFRDLLWLKKCW